MSNIMYIIAPNIKTGGGKELLEYLLEYIIQNRSDLNIIVYVDVSMNHLVSKKNIKVVHLTTVYSKIKLFSKKLENAIYFGNLPPLVKSYNSLVYFHNPYLVMDINKLMKTSFKFFLKYIIQRLYLKCFIKNVDLVACQNEIIKKSFINIYKFEKVELLPFFRLCDKYKENNIKKIYDFCYVSLAHPHKNHDNLIKALNILSDKGIYANIALTIEKEQVSLINEINEINSNKIVNIDNKGVIPKREVCKLYSQSRALVFPSLQETFGLGLIEAVEMELDIIACDLDYVYEAVIPSLVFNPNDSNDIADKLEKYLNEETKKSQSIIKNKLEDLINYINKKEKK